MIQQHHRSSKQQQNEVFKRQFQKINSNPKKRIFKTKKQTTLGNNQFTYIFAEDEEFKLGKGSYGQVYKCYYSQGSHLVKFALKIIQIPNKYEQIKSIQDIVSTTRQQIKSLVKLRNNPNIVKIQDLVSVGDRIYMVLQYCRDGDLISFFKKLSIAGKLKNIQIIYQYFAQLLNAFKDLNQNNIIHRDMKPGNILVDDEILKVADFGLSKQKFQKNQKFDEHVGTPSTAAPQIKFRQSYTDKCDIYSLGIVLYWMIYGKYPVKDNLTKQQYLQHKIDYPDQNQQTKMIVPEETKELIRNMLAYDQKDRIQWTQLFQHDFFKVYLNMAQRGLMRYSKTGRQLGRQFANSDNLDNQIPQQLYKYIKADDIRMTKAFNRISNQKLQSFISITKQIKNFNLKIFFFKELTKQLHSFIIGDKSGIKTQQIIMKDIVRLGIQKYIIYLQNQLNLQLSFKIPSKMFKQKDLNQANQLEQFVNYSKDQINNIRLYQQSQTKPKLSKDNIHELIRRCQQYQIEVQFNRILRQPIYEVKQYLVEVNKAIVQLIYYLKHQIKSLSLQKGKLVNQSESSRFKALILLVHHLYMFIMHQKIFPTQYDPSFNIELDLFAQKQQYKDARQFEALSNNITTILDQFEE